jgi:histidinol-phosphate/aromatic aminotransferase/cobyric acid decarboxylase-like protein
VKNILRTKGWFEQELHKLSVKTYLSAGNFLLADFGSGASEMCQKLQTEGVLLRDRSKDIGTGLVRVTIGTQKEMERLLKLIKRHR